MPWKKHPCPGCGKPIEHRSDFCWDCSPSVRHKSPETRAKMAAAKLGQKRNSPSASTRPEVAKKIQDWWTPERREHRRQDALSKNPEARYHGLSSRKAAQIVKSVGHCQECGHDGSESRLGIHHKDRNKRNQSPDNIQVLCHRCHMREHAAAGETGWDGYWKKRRYASASLPAPE